MSNPIFTLPKESCISPESVVEAAKNKDSPLHDYFECNDEEAARKYREMGQEL
jgi:hypothetical protein